MNYFHNVSQMTDIERFIDDAIGYRSPCLSLQHGGNTSPGQGRSIREFEEQMAALRKENFNLKLRIYFLEEKIPGYSSSNNNQDGHETLLKQNVDLKVDIEVLRKELQEKQTLLCEAAKAMDLMEQQQKQIEEQSQTIIDELNEKIRYLESENKELEKSPNGQHTLDQLMGRTELGNDIDTVQKIRELEGFIKQYEQKTDELTEKINELETNINQKDENIVNLEIKIKQLEYHNSELQEQLDIKEKENLAAENKIKEIKTKLNELKNENNIEKQQLLMDYEKLKNNFENEKISNNEQNNKIQLQNKLMEDMQLSIFNRIKIEKNLSKAIEDYETVVTELKNEKRRLYKENTNLKNTILKIENTTKFYNYHNNDKMRIDLNGCNCNTKIKLSSNRRKKTIKNNKKLNRRKTEHNYYQNSDTLFGHIPKNPFLTNPLFLPDISNNNNTICDYSGDYCNSTEYELKHRFSLCINHSELSSTSSSASSTSASSQATSIKKRCLQCSEMKMKSNQSSLCNPIDPNLYITETRNFHRPVSVNNNHNHCSNNQQQYCSCKRNKKSSSSSFRQNFNNSNINEDREIPHFAIDIERALESINYSLIRKCQKSNSDISMRNLRNSLLLTSSNSLLSCSSHITLHTALSNISVNATAECNKNYSCYDRLPSFVSDKYNDKYCNGKDHHRNDPTDKGFSYFCLPKNDDNNNDDDNCDECKTLINSKNYNYSGSKMKTNNKSKNKNDNKYLNSKRNNSNNDHKNKDNNYNEICEKTNDNCDANNSRNNNDGDGRSFLDKKLFSSSGFKYVCSKFAKIRE